MVRRAALALTLTVVAACSSGTSASPPTTEPPTSLDTTTTTTPTPAFGDDVLLVWSPGGLPAGLADDLRGLGDVAVALGDVVATADGIPVEVVAFACDGATALLPADAADAVCGLGADEALLGETSASLRGLSGGASLSLADGPTLLVAGVVPDAPVGAAEVVLSHEGAAAAGVTVERYALLRHDGDRASVEAAIRSLAGDAPLRVRAPGETPFFRHADAVLPQSLVKARFGEFSVARLRGGAIDVDDGWRSEWIVTAELPLVGAVPCHRLVVPALRSALEEVAERGLLDGPVDRQASGCFNPRSIAGTVQPSRHAWGIALDVVGPTITPEVVAVFERWGFTWGGRWLTPDPIHFEYVREPAGG